MGESRGREATLPPNSGGAEEQGRRGRKPSSWSRTTWEEGRGPAGVGADDGARDVPGQTAMSAAATSPAPVSQILLAYATSVVLMSEAGMVLAVWDAKMAEAIEIVKNGR